MIHWLIGLVGVTMFLVGLFKPEHVELFLMVMIAMICGGILAGLVFYGVTRR